MFAKICGITQSIDAHYASTQGAWAIGFNFYKNSPRAIAVQTARRIIETLPNEIIKIGIFIDQTITEIQKIMDEAHLHFAQIYHHNYPEHLKKQMIYCIHNENEHYDDLKKYPLILLDAPREKSNKFGGSGIRANWEHAKKLAQNFKLILAGGLNPNNVTEAIQTVNPFAVDIASGIETSPGIKDHFLIHKLMQEVHNA